MTIKEKVQERFGEEITKFLQKRVCPSHLFHLEISDEYCHSNPCFKCWEQEYQGEKYK